MSRPNTSTRAVLRELVGRFDDMMDVAAEWLADDGTAEDYGQQLRDDFAGWYADAFDDEPLLHDLVQAALARVDWPTVAGRLLALAARQQLRTEQRQLERLLLERRRFTP